MAGCQRLHYKNKQRYHLKKKLSKLVKDRTAFVEGFAYRWQTLFQGRGPKRMNTKQGRGVNDTRVIDEDTESDSSISVSSLQHSKGRGPNTTHNGGGRKRTRGDGHFTPYSKKRPENRDIRPFDQSLRHGSTPNCGNGNSSQSKYIGATAQQELQMLSAQNQPPNTTNIPYPSGLGPTNMQTSTAPIDSTFQSSFSNVPNTPSLHHSIQLQTFGKQSTWDPHISSNNTQIQNFPSLGISLPPT